MQSEWIAILSDNHQGESDLFFQTHTSRQSEKSCLSCERPYQTLPLQKSVWDANETAYALRSVRYFDHCDHSTITETLTHDEILSYLKKPFINLLLAKYSSDVMWGIVSTGKSLTNFDKSSLISVIETSIGFWSSLTQVSLFSSSSGN